MYSFYYEYSSMENIVFDYDITKVSSTSELNKMKQIKNREFFMEFLLIYEIYNFGL